MKDRINIIIQCAELAHVMAPESLYEFRRSERIHDALDIADANVVDHGRAPVRAARERGVMGPM